MVPKSYYPLAILDDKYSGNLVKTYVQKVLYLV